MNLTEKLASLDQPTAAWLLQTSARNLRDLADVPRNDDGTYDARKLVQWAKDHPPVDRPLTDDDAERLLLIAETDLDDDQVLIAAETITELKRRHGDQVAITVAEPIVDKIIDRARCLNELNASPGYQRQQAKQAQEAAVTAEAESNLRIVIECRGCGKTRRGRSWVRRKVPADHAARSGYCPVCATKPGV